MTRPFAANLTTINRHAKLKVIYDVYIDWEKVRKLALKAAGNLNNKATHGPIRIEVTRTGKVI